MRLLVTRPEPDATRTAAELSALGHAVAVAPLLSVSLAEPPSDLARPAAIVISSQNGVRAFARWPQIRDWLGVPAFTAGPATARAMTALGFSDVHTGEGDSVSLVEAVRAEVAPDAGPILYPAARDRAGRIAETLMAGGYDINVIEAYRAEAASALPAAARTGLVAGTIDGVLLYSRRTAATFRSLAVAAGLTSELRRPSYFVVSTQVVDALGGIGATIHVADRPDEASLLALIPRPG